MDEILIHGNRYLFMVVFHPSHGPIIINRMYLPMDIGDIHGFSTKSMENRDEVERLFSGGLDSVGKEHFTSLYMRARERALTKRNITAAWAASGLFPFDPERVLRDTLNPLPELTVLNEVASCPQYEVLQKPVTPVTLVTTEALTSLYNLIKQETYTLNEPSKQRLQRHVQELASAAQISFAKQTLLQDQSRSLWKMNSEAKARRSTRSVVLGTAKVMSYEDLEEAGAKRAGKEKATADNGTGKGGRKRCARGGFFSHFCTGDQFANSVEVRFSYVTATRMVACCYKTAVNCCLTASLISNYQLITLKHKRNLNYFTMLFNESGIFHLVGK